MELKKIISEFDKQTNWQKSQCEKIKSHSLPVIIFGAGIMAKSVTEQLNIYGVEVAGYAESEKYYKPGKTYLGKPVFKYSELHNRPQDYVFVLGTADSANPTGGGRQGCPRFYQRWKNKRLFFKHNTERKYNFGICITKY